MDIRVETGIEQGIPRAHVIKRMLQALRRISAQPVNARVAFTDDNGPKGGADVRCRVVVTIPGQPPITITRVAPSARLAFDATYERAARLLARGHARWLEARRRPKKYYTAKRLLG
jgi:hypothetical protein